MTVNDWPGIANADTLSIAAKAAARAGVDLPEDVDRTMRTDLDIDGQGAEAWRAGLVDVVACDGQVRLKMTKQQAAAWRQARSAR